MGFVRHLPSPTRRAIVVTHPGAHRFHLGLLRIEGVTIWVLLAANISIALHCVYLEDGVTLPVDLGIHS